MNRGFLITRGLGCKGLLTTRGLGRCRVDIIFDDVRPRQLTNIGRGGSGRKSEIKTSCIFVDARLVSINGNNLIFPVDGIQQVDCSRGDTLRVIAKLPSVKRKIHRLVIKARFIRDIEF